MINLSKRFLIVLFFLFGFSLICNSQVKKALEVTDMMKFRQIQSPAISNDGKWISYSANPDRGDPEVVVYSSDGKKRYVIPRGERPEISADGNWVAAMQAVPAEEKLNRDSKEKPAKPGMVLLNTETGNKKVFENVKSFQFSYDGKWIAYQETGENGAERRGRAGRDQGYTDFLQEKPERAERKKTGSNLQLLSLQDEKKFIHTFVRNFAFDTLSQFLAFIVADTTGAENGVYIANLKNDPAKPESIYGLQDAGAKYLSWNNRSGDLAFLGGILDDEEELNELNLYLWTPGEVSAETVLKDEQLKDGWIIYGENRLQWSIDGKRLFLGIKPQSETVKEEQEEADSTIDIFDVESIVSDRGVDVWHWNDPLINSNQKISWNRIKNRTYTGLFLPEKGKFIPLADELMPDLRVTQNNNYLIGSSNVPYMKEITWTGRLNDYYLVDLETGDKRLILEKHQQDVRLSPDGRFVVYYKEGDWFLMNSSNLEVRNLTKGMSIPFANEDHDYPSPVPGYGVGGWLNGSDAVFIYDKFDIWQFSTNGKEPVCLTQKKGRTNKYIFRIHEFDREKQSYKPGEDMFVTAYHDLKKHTAIYTLITGNPGITKVVEEACKYSLLSKAKNSSKVLFTRETYNEFPDLWVADLKFKKPVKISDINPQISEFAWGNAELVEWTNMDGIPMQGVLIKPGNYNAGKKYPVLVYYYRFMSQRLFEFNEVVVNHRPCFPFYASNGYAVFLPDIRFDIGFPGYSATKCLIPGVQKLIDMGVADPDAIALHGHSWSGYQTAHVITQSNKFACAIAGAPVSNMISAYSGIRWGSGVARQFQYEQSQSRIGGSLWEYPERYIENSPVFFADRIETPLLIMFGDEDGAVPWYQGIELYLAMRRLEKDCVFLQYRGEPHHPQRYANKLDYTIKMKEYLDHYLKGEPAVEWIEKGVLYDGK